MRPSPRTAALFNGQASNVVRLGSGPSSAPKPRADRSRAEPRRRPANDTIGSVWGWTESAILSALSWLGSLVVEGLIHCAFVNHAGHPKVIQQILDDRAMTANAERRRSIREIRP